MCSTMLEAPTAMQLFSSLHPSRVGALALSCWPGSPEMVRVTPGILAPGRAGGWLGGTVPGRMLARVARGAKLVTPSCSRNVIKDGEKFAAHRINKVSSRYSQGENQREKCLPCVTQWVPVKPAVAAHHGRGPGPWQRPRNQINLSSRPPAVLPHADVFNKSKILSSRDAGLCASLSLASTGRLHLCLCRVPFTDQS